MLVLQLLRPPVEVNFSDTPENNIFPGHFLQELMDDLIYQRIQARQVKIAETIKRAVAGGTFMVK